MPDGRSPLTVPAERAEPYLHLDNRGLVVFDGERGVIFPENMLGWVRETIGLLIDERRATRHRGEQWFGGVVGDDGQSVRIYAGPPGALVSVTLTMEALTAIQTRLHGG